MSAIQLSIYGPLLPFFVSLNKFLTLFQIIIFIRDIASLWYESCSLNYCHFYVRTVGISYLQKPETTYLQNPSLAYWLSKGQPNKSNRRETFFISQIGNRYQVKYPLYGDFMVDDKYTIEVGGPSKGLTQITGVPQAYVVADGIKAGSGRIIPLWLFGFLY